MISAAPPSPSTSPSLHFSRSWATVWVLLSTFSTALSPFVLEDQRNVLVIFVCALSGPLIVLFRLPLGRRDLIWPAAAVLYLLLVALLKSGPQYLTSVGYTGMFVLSFLALCGALNTGLVARERVRHLLRRLIQAYAVLSLVQMGCSLAGLPVPNEILSKGLWSYNSLGVEPSHAARALAFTLLSYLLLSHREGVAPGLRQLWREEKSVILAFIVSIMLTGSTLGIAALPLTLLLALRLRWIVVGVGLLLLIWPVLQMIEFESVRRLVAFLSALPTMDILALSEADQSGAVRVMPMLLFIQQMSWGDISIWFGGGYEAIAYYVQGALIGVSDDLAMAGFIPGYVMVCGIVGTALFLYAFLGRFSGRQTSPLILLWILLLATAAWNSQLFWYGFMLIRVVHHFSKTDLGSRESAMRVSASA